MKKIMFMLALVAMTLMSCGGSSNGSISPVSEKIQGPLRDYFEVVVRDYKINDGNLSVEIKRIKEGFPSPWTEGMKVGYSDGYFEPLFTIEFQDADGNVLNKDISDIVFDREALEAIAALNVGETATITFNCNEKDAKKFKVLSTFEVHQTNSSSSSDSSDYDSDDEISSMSADNSSSMSNDDSSSSSSSEDWDALLDSYEEYVDKYISFAKKAAKGDMDALSEYPSLLEKAQELSNELSGAQGSMSSSQWSRYMRITNKMTNAAASM